MIITGFLTWPLILPWIKSISNGLDITFHVPAPQLSGHCDVISNRVRRHQQNVNRANDTRDRCVKILVFIVIYAFVLSCKNNLIYVLSWRPIYALTRVLFWCLFPSLLRNSRKNAKITLVWANNLFTTGVHALFFISFICLPMPSYIRDMTSSTSPVMHIYSNCVFSCRPMSFITKNARG